jgi:hypothetical protein
VSTTSGPSQYGLDTVPKYATHTLCGSIVEICEIEDEATFSVYCPTCTAHVLVGELSGDEDGGAYYLVKAPE